MNPEQVIGETVAAHAHRMPEGEPSVKLRPLFVGGCQRSGTTAFADYLNEHEAILMCQERYKRLPRERITPDLFTFERILKYRKSETNKPWNLEYYIRRHADIIASKDPERLRWIGDKNPGFVKTMGLLAENNPGARFIMLYRSVEEVAESWAARSKDPNDHWLTGENGFEMGVEAWNTALTKLREFIESNRTPRVLIVSYGDFFSQSELYAPLISRFLDLEFDEKVTRAWAEMSDQFEARRRRKESLLDAQRSFIHEHADREAESWVLDRIDRQWREPELYVEENREAALAALDEMEARAWRLEQRTKQLERRSMRERQEVQTLRKENQRLTGQLETLKSSRSWRLLKRIRSLRARGLGR